MVIRRVGALSCAKVAGVLYAAMGLLVGGIFSLAAIAGAMGSDELGGAAFGAIFGIGAIIALPMFYGVLGFVTTLVAAALYNLVAGMVGGIEMDVA